MKLSDECLFHNIPIMSQLCLPGTSSPEWIGFQEAEYKFFDHRTTWDQARRICSWFDSSLASVHSSEEEAFLANTLRKASTLYQNIIVCRKQFNPKIQSIATVLASSRPLLGRNYEKCITGTIVCILLSNHTVLVHFRIV